MEENKTAVEWLYEKINSNLTEPMSKKFKEIFEQAKAMEKEQIIEAYDERRCFIGYENGKEYYNETFEQQKHIEK